MGNGGPNIPLPENNQVTLRWCKSLDDCLYNADPLTAEKWQQWIRRVLRDEKKETLTEKINKENQSATEDQLYALELELEKVYPVGSTLCSSKDMVSL